MTKDKTKTNKRKKRENLPGKRSLWGRFLASLGISLARFFAKITYVDVENIPKDIPYVLAPNHQTYVDGLIVAKGLPPSHFERFSALIGADLKTDHGFMGKVILPVSRGVEVERHGNPIRGLVRAVRAAQADNIIMVHPEGTRTYDGLVAPLQDGASFIAMRSEIPLVPVYIEGGFEVFSRYDKFPKRKNPITKKKNKINIIFGEPLSPEDYEDPSDLTKDLEIWLKAKEAEYLKKNEGKLRQR